MSNLAVNTAAGTVYPFGGKSSQSVYDYFAGNSYSSNNPRNNNMHFIAPDGERLKPYRTFNRSTEENPKYPHFQFIESSNSLLTAWHGKNDKEPVEFESLNLNDMSRENVAWLRAAGEFNYLGINKSEKLMALAYYNENWRIDVRRSNNFQLREVVHHDSPVKGIFFHNDVVFSLSDKLIVSYPEDRKSTIVLGSCKNVIGWAQHPKSPHLILIEPESYKIIDLESLRLVKSAEWTNEIKWLNLLQNYSSYGPNIRSSKSAVLFSKDGNHLFLGGYGKVAVFNWNDMLRPRCLQPDTEKVLSINSEEQPCSKGTNNHVIDIEPVNRDRILCVTADGCLNMLNIRTDEKHSLMKSANGIRINSLQLCSNGKRLAMLGYHYGIDNYGKCKIESNLLVWKLSKFLRKAENI
jgi:hypothetical protein